MASNIQLSIVLISTLVIQALASVFVLKGERATIPCTVKITPGEEVLAAYWHKSNGTVVDDILVSLENDGEISGPGYERGEFDIAEDYSLIINEVAWIDGGNYTCVILVESSGWRINTTSVDVYIEPPTPQIDKCLFTSMGGNQSQTCTYLVADQGHDELNVTCFVLGNFSNINLYFRNQEEVISGIGGQFQVDGVNIRYVTILALPRSEPYECVARNQKSSNRESLTSILLKRQPVEANSNDTVKEEESDAVKHSSQAVIWLSVVVSLLLTLVLSLVIFFLSSRKRKCTSEQLEVLTDSLQTWESAGSINYINEESHESSEHQPLLSGKEVCMMVITILLHRILYNLVKVMGRKGEPVW